MTEQKLKVGIIGGGFYAAVALIPSLRATGRAEVMAVARRDAGARQKPNVNNR